MIKILSLMKKEFIQYKRNLYLIMTSLLLVPLIQLFLYSYTVSYDVKNIPMVILNKDQSLISQNLCNKFQNTSLFDMKKYIYNYNEIEDILKKEEAQIVLVIPETFSKDIKHNKKASLQLIVDGSDSNTAQISLNNASSIIKHFSQELILNRIIRHPIKIVRSPALEGLPSVLYNPQRKGIIDMAPAIIATILLSQILTIGSNTFAKEKEGGTITKLHLTKLNKQQYLIGKIIPIYIIGVVMLLFMLIVSILLFNMPIRGNIVLLFISTSIFILSLMNISFCVVTFTKTALQAFIFQGFIFMLPFIMFSGFLFPIETMPKILQGISFFNPLRHFIEILKGITLKGSTLINLRVQITMLFSISTVFFITGILAFKRTFE